MSDVIFILVLSIIGLLAHVARKQAWLEWLLRIIYILCCLAELFTVFNYYPANPEIATPWNQFITLSMGVLTGAMLFRPVRQLISYGLSALDLLASGQLFFSLIKKAPLKQAFQANRVFVASSIPHLNGLWIYI